jgi:predicted DNA binding CopG/RHH family protein
MLPNPKDKKPLLPKNAKKISQFTMDELKKTAVSRGIPLEKLIAQIVEQYLAEDKPKDPS